MAMRGPRLQVGSAAWVAEERSCALHIAQSEVEEFSYSARNELEWLNEHMAGIFNENETNIAETFKTPGKLRGKTPRTARKVNTGGARVPLSDVFAATPNGSTNRFAQQLNRIQSPRSNGKAARSSPSPAKNAARKQNASSPKQAAPAGPSQDSGYFGSQDVFSQSIRVEDDFAASQRTVAESFSHPSAAAVSSPTRHTEVDLPEQSSSRGKDSSTADALPDSVARSDSVAQSGSSHTDYRSSDDEGAKPDVMDFATSSSPKKSPMPKLPSNDAASSSVADWHSAGSPGHAEEAGSDEVRSPSDGSSPIRPVVRKSSLNFASLPAREPLTAGKSIGARVSRTSHLDHNRKSYYNRPTGGKSLGNHVHREEEDDEEEEEDAMDVDQQPQPTEEKVNPALNHNKTYTQRLQDQINLLGKSQPNGSRPSKSIPNIAALQQSSAPSQPAELPKSPSPKRLAEKTKTTPGAFPDDDDDWIEPPPTAPTVQNDQSPRPALSKSYTADVMEGIHKNDHVGDTDFVPLRSDGTEQSTSPQRPFTSQGHLGGAGHAKSASTSHVPLSTSQIEAETQPLVKAATVSNASMAPLFETTEPQTPSKSPSRGFRDSPLKQVKNKLSSLLKSSKGLIASSAAASAEGKSSMLSPSASRVTLNPVPSSESGAPKTSSDSQESNMEPQSKEPDSDKTVPIARRTRASTEKEKEEKRREKETKRMEEQMSKLEKAREEEREKARVFSKEQERIAAMERQMASKKEDDKPSVKKTPKATRSSPRKTQHPPESTTKPLDRDVEMADAPPTVRPPSAARSVGTSQVPRTKEIKRPVKPTKETQIKAKQAPTVIRVNTGSQHSQYHPSAGNSATNTQETPGASTAAQQQPLASKASKASLQTKTSAQNLRGAASVGRPKALDLAAKKKEQDEREAQRRREAKAEMERKRAAAQEEQRKQDQRRQEAERQKQKDREQAAAHADAKQSAQRQAMIEKAKQTRAPPPAVRTQPNGPPDFSNLSYDKPATAQRGEGQSVRPPSRLNTKPNEDSGRPVNAVLSNASKAGMKRTIGPDATEDAQSKRAPSRGGLPYQAKDAKRRRTSEQRDELETENPPHIKGPPVRPSAGFKKELPKKSLFQNGYTTAPPSATRDLFKATVTAQHTGQAKTAHPLDMAQISKGAIPFAPNPNAASQAHKTPARPPMANGPKSTAKSAPRTSPRFQNGESIELPEIQTDDEDEDEDDAGGMVAAWADSPDLRRALMRQETIDPSQIFGPPAPLNMEEVFSKNKDRWHKFRARTSSANWSGADRLTEDDIRKDMAARDKMRREGGWSYELGKDLV